MDVTVVHHTLYIFIHCLAIPYVCQMCRPFYHCYLMVCHVWMSVKVTWLSQKLYLTQKCPLIYTEPFECEEASIPVCVGMCWHGSLMGDCSLISLCFEFCLWTLSEVFIPALEEKKSRWSDQDSLTWRCPVKLLTLEMYFVNCCRTNYRTVMLSLRPQCLFPKINA